MKVASVLRLRFWESNMGNPTLLSNYFEYPDIIKIIERSASRAERYQSRFFLRKNDKEVIANRYETWKVNNVDEKFGFEKSCSIRGLRTEDIIKCLDDVQIANLNELPEWAAATAFIMTELYEREQNLDKNYSKLFEPFQDIIIDYIQMHLYSGKTDYFSISIFESIFNHIVTKFSEIISENSWQIDTKETLISSWIRLFVDYPKIARQFAEALIITIDFANEIFKNFYKHKEEINNKFSIDSAIKVIDFGLGDTHNCGRAVAILFFESGQKLVYKPKNNAIVEWIKKFYHTFFENLPFEFQIKFPQTLTCDNFCWEEFIEEKECNSQEEGSIFYAKVGVLIFLAQLTRTQDLHGENIIANGCFPVPIDLEAMGGTSPILTGVDHSWLNASFARYITSPLMTGMLPVLEIDSNKKVFYDTAFPSQNKNTNKFALCLPVFNNKALLIEMHIDDVLRGYKTAKELFKKKIDYDILKELQNSLNTAITRFIPRSTSLYAILANEVLANENAATHIELELLYEQKFFSVEIENETILKIIDEEIWSLTHGDIPFFSINPGNKLIYKYDNTGIPADFEVFNLCDNVREVLSEKSDFYEKIIQASLGILNLSI